MNKKVTLTWRPENRDGSLGPPLVEEVLLVSEDQRIFGLSDSIDTPVLDATQLMDMMSDFVLFEDESGIFGVKPSQIIQIEII